MLRDELLELRRQQVLLNYPGCGVPDDKWFDAAIEKNFTAIDAISADEVEHEIKTLKDTSC